MIDFFATRDELLREHGCADLCGPVHAFRLAPPQRQTDT
jgi:hypothetical protein